MDKFKLFLLNEENGFLGQKVGDILTSALDIQNDMDNLGERHLTRLSQDLIDQIRKILHSQWSVKNYKHLEQLQKIAVALSKAIEDKGTLKDVIPSAVQELKNVATDLGSKVNDLKAPEQEGGEDIDQSDFQLTGDQS